MSVCVIACIFGKRFKAVYPSVKKYDAFLFSNNPELKETIERAGWKYVFIDFPLSDDEAVSDFQSKYIKFLQFLKDDPLNLFYAYDKIVYVDRKLELKDEHVEYLLSKMDDSKILIRKHPENIKSIWGEAGKAILQERYFRFMPQTIGYIREKIAEGYSERCVIALTNLIVYSNMEKLTMEFADKIYNDLKMIGTSQCQIIWSLIGQQYTDIIKTIKWNELKIKSQEPEIESEDNENNGFLMEELLNKTNQIEQIMERESFPIKGIQNEIDKIEQVKESISYFIEELKNKTRHIDMLMESERQLSGELQGKTGRIEQLMESESLLSLELRNKTGLIEQLVSSERKLTAEINAIFASKTWKIASMISACSKKIFPRYSRRRQFAKLLLNFVKHPFGFITK